MIHDGITSLGQSGDAYIVDEDFLLYSETVLGALGIVNVGEEQLGLVIEIDVAKAMVPVIKLRKLMMIFGGVISILSLLVTFRVMAELFDESRSSAEYITILIKGIVSQSTHALKSVEEEKKQVLVSVDNINETDTEMSNIATLVNNVTTNIQTQSVSLEEISASIEELNTTADKLHHEMSKFIV